MPNSKLWFAIKVPASDISIVNAVIPDPPSSPLNTISLSCVATVKSTSVELFVIVNILVPASLKIISAQSASKIISASASSVILPEDKESISAITGVVKVLFVKVSVDSSDTKLSFHQQVIIIHLLHPLSVVELLQSDHES